MKFSFRLSLGKNRRGCEIGVRFRWENNKESSGRSGIVFNKIANENRAR